MNENQLAVGSLFSGIGGFDLGLARAGMRIAWHSEIDPYASAVLKRHWPDVPNHGDIRTITADRVERVNVLCGGFPCQDISNAGKRAGIDGERSGLWSEFARLIGELRPRYAIMENVAALLGRGMERVLGDLAALGYDAEWQIISAADVGAPHLRERVWIVAYPRRSEWRPQSASGNVGNGNDTGWQETTGRAAQRRQASNADESLPARSDAGTNGTNARDEQARFGPYLARSLQYTENDTPDGQGIRRGNTVGFWWVEPDVGRVAHGIPRRVDRLRCLGNAIVPQIAEVIGRAIIESDYASVR